MRVLLLIVLFMLPPFVYANGAYEGRVIVEWIQEDGPDRTMKLVESIKFTDPDGVEWVAPEGWEIDGASIPKIFWNLVGPPFVGDYRRASVLHDYFCDVKTRPWRDVHRLFYHASIAGGVSESKAKVMYAAVFAGGPRWKKIKTTTKPGVRPQGVIEQTISAAPIVEEDKFDELVKWVNKEDPNLIEIETRVKTIVTDNLNKYKGVEEM